MFNNNNNNLSGYVKPLLVKKQQQKTTNKDYFHHKQYCNEEQFTTEKQNSVTHGNEKSNLNGGVVPQDNEEKPITKTGKTIFRKKQKDGKAKKIHQHGITNKQHSNADINNKCDMKTTCINIPIILINGIALLDLEEPIEKILPPCSVGGEGLNKANVGYPNIFFIETQDQFDKKKVHVSLQGPKQAPIKMETCLLDINLCKFTYWPHRTGVYVITVKWKDEHVLGSPFYVTAVIDGT